MVLTFEYIPSDIWIEYILGFLEGIEVIQSVERINSSFHELVNSKVAQQNLWRFHVQDQCGVIYFGSQTIPNNQSTIQNNAIQQGNINIQHISEQNNLKTWKDLFVYYMQIGLETFNNLVYTKFWKLSNEEEFYQLFSPSISSKDTIIDEKQTQEYDFEKQQMRLSFLRKMITNHKLRNADFTTHYYASKMYQRIFSNILYFRFHELLENQKQDQNFKSNPREKSPIMLDGIILLSKIMDPFTFIFEAEAEQKFIYEPLCEICTRVENELVQQFNSSDNDTKSKENMQFNTQKEIQSFLKTLNYVLFDVYKFYGDSFSYYSISNGLIHHVLRKKTGIPISLSAIYEYICLQFGVQVEPISAPSHFLLRVPKNVALYEKEETQLNQTHQSQDTSEHYHQHHHANSQHDRDKSLNYFWVDPFHSGRIYTSTESVANDLFNGQVKPESLISDYCKPYSHIYLRMITNLITFYQFQTRHHLQTNPDEINDLHLMTPETHIALITLPLIHNPKDVHARVGRLELAVNYGRTVLARSDVEALKDQDPELHQHYNMRSIQSLVRRAEAILEHIEAEHDELPEVKTRDTSDPGNDRITYRVGQVMRHRRYHYRGVVYGYDENCKLSVDWQRQMGVTNNQQPFYNVLVDHKDRMNQTTYVAQSNIGIVSDESELGNYGYNRTLNHSPSQPELDYNKLYWDIQKKKSMMDFTAFDIMDSKNFTFYGPIQHTDIPKYFRGYNAENSCYIPNYYTKYVYPDF